MKPDSPSAQTDKHTAEQGRRQLLKMTAYVPPVILGVMLTASDTAEAATIKCGGTTYTVSASGIACCPCVTNPGGSTCRRNQCQQGNCNSCISLGGRRCRRDAPAACRPLCP
ncbi:MAG TPA: hypothetical protein VNI58_03265 [Mariprofundaceae bacterium]|nr:hypothetical protein [Mariprofundaceae bacterium]